MKISRAFYLGPAGYFAVGIALMALSGCGGGRYSSTRTKFTPAAYAERLAMIVGKDPYLVTSKDLLRLREKIFADIKNGYQDSIAGFLLSKGRWRKTLWFAYAEEYFADIWKERGLPVTICASVSTMQALEHIAGHGLSRQARVSAAIVLLPIKPDVAKLVLRKEYGNFQVSEWLGLYDSPPLGTGEALTSAGTYVVPEVTTTWEFKRLLRLSPSWKPKKKIDQARLAAGANEYNRRLRKLFQTGDWDAMDELSGILARSEFAERCYNECTPPAGSEEGSIFGGSDDSGGHSIFDEPSNRSEPAH